MSDNVVTFPRKLTLLAPAMAEPTTRPIRVKQVPLDYLSPEAVLLAKATIHANIAAQVKAAREMFSDDVWMKRVLLQLLEDIP